MRQSKDTNSTIIVVEPAGRNVLLSGTQRACDSLASHTSSRVLQPHIICVDQIPSDIQALCAGRSNLPIIATVEASLNLSSAAAICEAASAAGVNLAVAEQSVGSASSVWAAGQILSLVHHGATAVFREYDFIAEDTILRLLIESMEQSKVKATLIGEPAARVKALLEEVTSQWNDPDTGMVFRPEITFRVASALTQVPYLDSNLNTREKIAHELNRQGWFSYNVDDTRKAVGSLTTVWNLHTRTLSMLPEEARRRGFPHPSEAEALFNFIEGSYTDERVFTSASGTQFHVLYISEI